MYAILLEFIVKVEMPICDLIHVWTRFRRASEASEASKVVYSHYQLCHTTTYALQRKCGHNLFYQVQNSKIKAIKK